MVQTTPLLLPGQRGKVEKLFSRGDCQKERQGMKRDGVNSVARLVKKPMLKSKRDVLGAAALYRPNGRLKAAPPQCPEHGVYLTGKPGGNGREIGRRGPRAQMQL